MSPRKAYFNAKLQIMLSLSAIKIKISKVHPCKPVPCIKPVSLYENKLQIARAHFFIYTINKLKTVNYALGISVPKMTNVIPFTDAKENIIIYNIDCCSDSTKHDDIFT